MAKAKLKVTSKGTSDLGTVVMHTVELLDADGVMKEYGIKDYHDDNGIIDTEIEDISTGEDIDTDSTLGKSIIHEIDSFDFDNMNTSSFGNDIDDAHYDKYADDPNLEVQLNDMFDNSVNRVAELEHDNISVSEKVNYFLAELGINDDEFEDHIHTLITHHKHVQSDKRDSMTYEDAHVNHDIVVPCSAKLDNEMYNESI